MRALRIAVLALAPAATVALAVGGCSSLRYYGQAVRGGLSVALGAEPIERVLARPDTPAEVSRQLELVLELRGFAGEELGLDVGKRYRRYRALGREAVVWNVVAAPELAVEPRTWCFPVAGCVSYRGYFRREGAERFAARMRRRGFDVAVTGATAYSTLGWLRDPVLDTFLGGTDARLAGLLFHELAHATVYAKGDTAFNESYATVVEEAGVRRWLAAAGRDQEWAAHARHLAAERFVLERLVSLRDRLGELYASSASDDDKRRRKDETIARFQTELARAIDRRPELEPWRRWAERELGNAHVAAVALYSDWVAPLAAHLEAVGWPAFLTTIRHLADLTHDERQARLEALPSPPLRPQGPSPTIPEPSGPAPEAPPEPM